MSQVGTIKGYHSGVKTIANIYDVKQSAIGETKVLMHFDAPAITDECGNTWTQAGTTSALGLNGSSCIVANDQTNFNLSTTFTIEAWIYPRSWKEARGPDYVFPIISRWSHYVGTLWMFVIGGQSTTGEGKINFGIANKSSGSGDLTNILSSYDVPLNKWSHIAASRDSNNVVRLFLNGTLMVSKTITNTVYNLSSYPTTIGASSNQIVWADGYIDDVRISNSCRYTADFTPPSRGSISKDSNTVSLLKFDSSTTADECDHTWTQVGSPSIDSVLISSAQSKFGGKALYGNDSSWGILCNQHNAYIGTQPFTIDWWEYIENRDTGRWRARFDFDVSGQFACAQGPNTSYASFCIDVNEKRVINYPANVFPVTYGTWMHRAMTRDTNNVLRCFSNGTKTYETTFAHSIENKTRVCIGNSQAAFRNSGAVGLTGYMDEFRVVVGKAIWTANFTPPTSTHTVLDDAFNVNGNMLIRHNNANCYIPLTSNKANTSTPCLAVRHGSTNYYAIK